MCGIFGFSVKPDSQFDLQGLASKILLLSETRGRDATGVCLKTRDKVIVARKAAPASEFIKSEEYSSIFREHHAGDLVTFIGHTRLATNGREYIELNNQPVVVDGFVAVHNGIITNEEDFENQVGEKTTDLDTEVFLRSMDYANFISSLEAGMKKIKGTASLAIVSKTAKDMFLTTNNGSLYFAATDMGVFFASEKLILEKLFTESDAQLKAISQAELCSVYRVETSTEDKAPSICKAENQTLQVHSPSYQICDYTEKWLERRQSVKRCSKCVIPATFPYIEFDKDGVCSICQRHDLQKKNGIKAAHAGLDEELRPGKDGKSLMMLSGGRDSCFGMHVVVRELGMKVIAYTYDWGMVTDIARRNAERMCGELGVEHIIVAADISRKRRNIQKNINAWLKRPRLGTVPLFMAGDKQFLYYGKKIREINGLDKTITATCPYEKTGFKTGFAGIDEKDAFIYKVPLSAKLKYAAYFAKEFACNPRYLNSSVFDSVGGFWSAYFSPHDFYEVFHSRQWDEQEIEKTLGEQYGWEFDKESQSSWRIGDGTAAFYNYIYYNMAGFTENDTFRSHQIRAGKISRAEALERVEKENRPRWRSLEWYASVVGFNLADAVRIINNQPKLYIEW